MKILKRGTIPPTWKERVICTGKGNGGGGCGSNLEVHLEDVYQTTSTDYGGGTDSYYTIMCPVCSVETDIKGPSSAVPMKREWLRKRNSHSEN